MLNLFKSHSKSLSKFAIVGIVNTAIDFAVFFILYEYFGLYFVIAHVCAFILALSNSFIFNAIWTFKALDRDQLVKQVLLFFTVALIGLGLSSGFIYVASFFMNMYVAKILAMVVATSWGYVGSWLFVFKGKSLKQE